ncbi:MAG: sulfatase-like hydrolase/transferase, partial [Planctomycetia bacterium]|nr:sulfatase-like hydrolase/transferase [Planctomycetia bacterium]
TAADEKPNIVFILADDLGFADLGCYGHPYAKTPALDQLAKEGTAFRNFHVTGVTCCPSRTGFMTGKFPATFRKYPADHGFGDRVTVTQLLHGQGYRTGHFGKWHIGPDAKAGTYGFDAVGDESGAEGRRHDDSRGRDAQIFDQAIAFIADNKDRPFYLNVWGHISHFQIDPPPAYVERFKDVTVRESDFAAPMQAKFDVVRRAGGDLNQHMRRYLADVLSLDDSIGRLLANIDELGLREKTVVVFSSDQGAAPVQLHAEAAGKKSAKAAKRTAEKADARLDLLGYVGDFRGGKHNMYEGGVRAPFIIRWPGHVPAGRVDEKSLFGGIDWLPTLCRLTGAKLPSTDLDGEDALDIWLGQPRDRTKPLFWKTSTVRSNVAVLDGNWKLIWPGAKRGETELYDLASDPGETKNVASQNPN